MRLLHKVMLLLLTPILVFGSTNGSKSLWHTQMGRTLSPGRLELRTDMNFYTKVGDYLGQDKPEDFVTVNYWDVQGNALLTYGVMEHLDASLLVRTYQDVHHGEDEANIPGDIFLDIKTGGWELRSPKFNFATLLSLRFPTGNVHNYPFEPYASPAITTGFNMVFSYYNDPYLADRDISAHVNVGYELYNEAGKVIYETSSTKFYADGNSAALTYAAGLVFPTTLFDLTLEMHGLAFTSQPDSMVYSRENFVYLTPGIKVKPFAWMAFKMGFDFRLSSDTEESADILPAPNQNLDLPNYTKWKFRMGVDFTIMPVVSFTKSRTEIEREDLGRKVEFFEEIIQERQKAEKVEDELKRLRSQREEAEKELEELRQLLEETGGE